MRLRGMPGFVVLAMVREEASRHRTLRRDGYEERYDSTQIRARRRVLSSLRKLTMNSPRQRAAGSGHGHEGVPIGPLQQIRLATSYFVRLSTRVCIMIFGVAKAYASNETLPMNEVAKSVISHVR